MYEDLCRAGRVGFGRKANVRAEYGFKTDGSGAGGICAAATIPVARSRPIAHGAMRFLKFYGMKQHPCALAA